ncbi:hypothetical protein Agub_g7426 [Astrephomene gubernaculifera]|uniref:Uncharacterized protein n=1 Tax=Astrephomene gubernaculifera TaxID=47775 RepID=A0AAD3DSS6_9CHLO|nr:hypothetical protein Agub_g7426 [Astrephomene gubernaculifera]
MRHSNGRSISLQRCPRPSSAKRGQRASTPSRRLSDLQERPAWDATSSNLDKFKLSAEELERRKAARISKNRPLAADVKRSFIEAWAKDVSASAQEQEQEADTANDQDRPRSSPAPARELPIDYGSVIDMLRKSPGAARVAAAHATADSSAPSAGPTPGARGGEPRRAGVHFADPGDTAADGGADSKGPRQQKQQAEGSGEEAVAPGGGAAGVRRAEISVTPAALRPRFNPAEATTIIAFGGDSDVDEHDAADADVSGDVDDEEAVAQTRSRGPEAGDAMTAAFGAALFGRERGGAHEAGAGEAAGGGLSLAWATSRGAASPLDAGMGDVERRLRALEAAMPGSSLGGSGGGSGAGSLLQEDVSELRQELRKVQQDNAKLRQELSAFSAHASTLLTQLQAQVNQLLRSSSGGASVASSGAPASQPLARPQPQQQPLASISSLPAVAAIPTTVLEASRSVGYGFGNTMETQPQFQPSSQPLHVPLNQAQQPVVRRNIFADLDESVLRPLGAQGAGKAAHGGGGEAGGLGGPAASPYSVYGAVSSRPVAAGIAMTAAAAAAGTAASPRYPAEVAAPVQYAPQAIPVQNIDDAEIALPSFAAFRRAAGAAAFTATRAPASTSQAPLVSPMATNAGPGSNNTCATGPDGPGPSPPTAAAMPSRPFPTQYQPRSLGGVLVRCGPGADASAPHIALGPASVAAAAAASNNASGAYAASLAATAAAAASGSDAAAAELARTHAGLPQPLVFSMGPEFRTARASGLSAENSMSLSAHTAAAASLRSKTTVVRPGVGLGR